MRRGRGHLSLFECGKRTDDRKLRADPASHEHYDDLHQSVKFHELRTANADLLFVRRGGDAAVRVGASPIPRKRRAVRWHGLRLLHNGGVLADLAAQKVGKTEIGQILFALVPRLPPRDLLGKTDAHRLNARVRLHPRADRMYDCNGRAGTALLRPVPFVQPQRAAEKVFRQKKEKNRARTVDNGRKVIYNNSISNKGVIT